VEMAKLFGSDSSPRFINGVLGAVMGETDRPSLGEAQANGDEGRLTPEPVQTGEEPEAVPV